MPLHYTACKAVFFAAFLALVLSLHHPVSSRPALLVLAAAGLVAGVVMVCWLLRKLASR